MDVARRARMKLQWVRAAREIGDLRSPPGNRLERLKGDREEYPSIRINEQGRVVFRFKDGHAYEVTVEDYHR